MYHLFSEDISGPVGFTAYAEDWRSYQEDDLVLFESVVTNLGAHYNPVTSTFLCPYDGVYLFSVSFNANSNYRMRASIIRNSSYLADALAYTNENPNHASALVITDCSPGSKVWVRSYNDNNYMTADPRTALFSGYLLHRYQ